MFVQTWDNQFVSVDQIKKCRWLRREGQFGVWAAELLDGSAVEISDLVLSKIRSAPSAAFAARPDTFLLTVYEEAGHKTVFSEAVIGWALLADGTTAPITPLGLNDGLSEDVYVRMPDDTVVGQNKTWKSHMEFRQQNGVTDGALVVDDNLFMAQN